MKKLNFIYGFLVSLLFLASCTNAEDYEFVNPEEQQELFSEKFADATLGSFTAQSVSGAQSWTGNDKGYAIVTGYVNSQNLANEAWLISPKIDLTNQTTAHLTFDHVPRYFANVETEATVWISENYVDGLPSTASWTQLVTQPFRDPGSWDFGSSGQISLTAYAGKKVRIAFKYISTATKAGTWEVKNFLVKSGEAVVVGTNYGKGTEELPYTVAGAILNQSGGKWITGTIVGYLWSGSQTNYIFGADTCTQATNLLLAESPDFGYISRTLPVQLPAGAVRSGLNLKDNKSLIGRKVKLYGELASYFSVPGIKNISYYEFDNGTFGGTKPFDAKDAILAETLLTVDSYNKFTAVSVVGAQSWSQSAQYGAMISGFANSRSYANEDWFISPAIDLSGKTSVNLAFDHARGPAGSINVGVNQGYYTVWVSNNYESGAPATATWTEIKGVNHGNTAWGFVFSGTLSIPSENLKANARIAFKYLCTDSESATWEIKNVIVK